MGSILYMPDGNRRYAQKKNISLEESYLRGGKTLRLFSEFFLVGKKADTFIWHVMSKYTHQREDGSLQPIYDALGRTFEELYKERFFSKNGISFQVIDHSGKLPSDLKRIIKELTSSSQEGDDKVIVLLGYSLVEDINKCLLSCPKDYQEFREGLIFSDIDLVIRTIEMRPSGGPVYAMSQSQMMILNKFNPEVTRIDLEELWGHYIKLNEYRK